MLSLYAVCPILFIIVLNVVTLGVVAPLPFTAKALASPSD
jgi:hypothetical protein